MGNPTILKNRKKGRPWLITMLISKELYFYNFPFTFPKEFLTHKDKYDLKLKLELIRILSTSSIMKVFYVEYFLSIVPIDDG